MPCHTIGLNSNLTAPNETFVGGTHREGPTRSPLEPIVRPVPERTLNGAGVGLRRPPTETVRCLFILTRDVRFYVVGTVRVEDYDSIAQPWNDLEVVHNRKCFSRSNVQMEVPFPVRPVLPAPRHGGDSCHCARSP